MKDEIKEIKIPENVLVALGDLTNGALNYYKATETVKVRHNTILDYITNLQKENERLKEIIKDNTILVKDENGNYQECNINPLDYKSRNEKAIEKIKKIQKNAIKYGADHDAIMCQDLLNILQGENKE